MNRFTLGSALPTNQAKTIHGEQRDPGSGAMP